MLVRGGNGSVAAAGGHGWPAAAWTASRRQPRPRSPVTVTTTLTARRGRAARRTPRRRWCLPTARGTARRGARRARPSAAPGAIAEHLEHVGQDVTLRRAVVLAERHAGQRPGRLADGPGALGRPLGVSVVQVVGPHDLGRVLLALQVAEPGVDLRPERGRPRAVLVRRRAQDHVVLDLAGDLQAEPGRHVPAHAGRQRLLVRPLRGQDQEHAERPADLDDEDRVLAGLLAVAWDERTGSGTRRSRTSAGAASGCAGWRSRG